MKAFCSLLKRDVALNYKSKGNPLVSVLACNVLMGAFADEKHWPDNFVKVSLNYVASINNINVFMENTEERTGETSLFSICNSYDIDVL